ncbi:MAG: outer membrane protein assembly factor BamD [Gammaproteobacteria bacterium]|nr:outer membrane protein assembly factor BamD [Gammaproteobacteria bacterium]
MRLIYRLLLIVVVLGSTACASIEENDPSNWGAARYYEEAQKALKQNNYETAIQYLESLEGQFPYDRHAEQARLDLAYVYYLHGETESAIAAADRFIKTHPLHDKVDYAYYLRGLALFDDKRKFLYETFNQDPTHRNAEGARQSFLYFAELVRKYPDSEYSKDARQRMIHLRNRLAAYEVYVANFYLERDAFVAAANRGKYVVENFENTPAVADALVVLVKAYRKMGMDDLANDSMRVLTLNYPQHPELLKIAQ